MYTKTLPYRSRLLLGAVLLMTPTVAAQARRPLTFEDLMHFRAIHDPVISRDGTTVAYAVEPDRGNGEVRVQAVDRQAIFRFDRGSQPVFSRDSRWLAAVVKPDFVKLEQEGKEKPRPGMALLDLDSGRWISRDQVQSFAFSRDSRWLVYHRYPPQQEKKDAASEEKEKEKDAGPGGTLVLRRLQEGSETEIEWVDQYLLDPQSRYLVYSRKTADGRGNGIFARPLGPESEVALARGEGALFSALSWSREGEHLAFLESRAGEQDTRLVSLDLWDPESARPSRPTLQLPQGWQLPAKNKLTFSRDAGRLFLGLRPRDPAQPQLSEAQKNDPFNRQAILSRRQVDVWHWNDPLIIPNQKKRWKRDQEHTYLALYDLAKGRLLPLTDRDLPEAQPVDNPLRVLATSDIPYRKEITWEGRFRDVWVVGLKDGKRTRVARRLASRPSLSPGGRFVLYYQARHWHLYDCASGRSRNLTRDLDVPFANEDHDYPSPPPGYGTAGWLEGDRAVLVYDKYDLWMFPTDGSPALNLTAGDGRRRKVIYRVLKTDPERRFWKEDERLLLSAYYDLEKHTGFYEARVGRSGVRRLLEQKKRYRFLARAAEADRVLFTRESYQEFPDLWVAASDFSGPRRVSDANPQMKELAWGRAELVKWRSLDGIPLQGVLIKPAGYQEGHRYPVLVYFYRFFSQRLYQFNQPVVNHRPSFALYASHGYAIFLPDIRFQVGRPGFSSTKCLVPGVEKLIEMGVADPRAVALHGHSWSGYQTAFVITQTDIFAAAIAGAPVSNMTSSYGGIRWGTGLARQFQYEKTQSRIGGSLWEYPERYIENSPLFYADRIHTPLLIMFGDKDTAVPWTQGIELYLAMRRLGKECVFLEYRDEPHHPQKYANKLDYAIRMKEYLDHYLKGAPAPEWIRRGVPYRGK